MGQSQSGDDRRADRAFTHPARDHIMRALWGGDKLSAAGFARTSRETVERALYHFHVLERTTMIVCGEVAGDEHTDYAMTEAGRAAFALTTA